MTWGRSITESRERRQSERDRNMAALCSATLRPISRATMEGGTAGAVPKGPQPVRDESYRRWVASLPCHECGIEGYSQAAHPNSGKAKGVKLSDLACFPLCCDRPSVVGCHSRFDRYELVSRADMPQYEEAAKARTRCQWELRDTGAAA